MTKGEVIAKIGRMIRLADLFGQEPEFRVEFRARCAGLARAIAEEGGLCQISDGRNLPPETVLGERATTAFETLEQWFNTQAKIKEGQDAGQAPATG